MAVNFAYDPNLIVQRMTQAQSLQSFQTSTGENSASRTLSINVILITIPLPELKRVHHLGHIHNFRKPCNLHSGHKQNLQPQLQSISLTSATTVTGFGQNSPMTSASMAETSTSSSTSITSWAITRYCLAFSSTHNNQMC